jgi:two-component system, cell cycle sensor histidine kinase and response regulator CckA
MSEHKVGKILVVDDEAELMNALVEALTSQCYQVAGFTNCRHALEVLREEDFDLLLSDLMMPEMDGIRVVRAALEIDPHLVCIIMTGQDTLQTAVDALKTGVFDYVVKPVSRDTIMLALARAMKVRQLRLENLQLRQTVAIYDLGQTIAFTLDPQTILSRLADAALQHTEADEVSILLPTEGGDELYVAEVRGEDRQRLLGERVSLEESISGWVARERQPLLLQGDVNDVRFRPLWPHPGIRSAVSIPIQLANKLVGIININALNRKRAFTLGQVKALSTLATTAASALESASLYGRVRASEERYRELVENAHDIIYSHDLEGNYMSINKAGELITGYTVQEALKLNFTDTIAPEFLQKAREMVKRKLAGERVTAYELEIIAKDGRRITVEVNTKLVYQDGVPVGVQGIARDASARKQLEDQLRQSQKMEAIGRLAGGVAHDFNNLLTAINGYSKLALQRLDDNSSIRPYLEEVKKAGERAANLTRQLLAFGRKQILQPLPLDLNSVVTDMNKMLRRLIGEDIELTATLASDLKRIIADPGQIEQVLVNLIVNARDAMPTGGKIIIETANAQLDLEYTNHHVGVKPGNYVMLAVSDTGIGMNEETRARIFEPFFTTKDEGKGTGLGLSTVYGIVQQSGGSIWVYSEPNRGTSFKVYLPELPSHAEIREAHAKEDELLAGSETVLLVEDDEVVRRLTQKILEQAGYKVLAATGGEEAMRLCSNKHSIDLLLTDVVMPESSGKEVADRLSTLIPGLSVLYMSGYTDEAIVHHGVLDSNVKFIQKPFTPAALAKKVREILDANGRRVH